MTIKTKKLHLTLNDKCCCFISSNFSGMVILQSQHKSLLCHYLQDVITHDSLTFKHLQYSFPFTYHWKNSSWLTRLWLMMIHPRVSINEKVLPIIWKKTCNIARIKWFVLKIAANRMYWQLVGWYNWFCLLREGFIQ